MPEFRIMIDVKEVGGGDIDQLVERIEDDYGPEFDAHMGHFMVRAAQKQGDHYFTRDPGDDVLEGEA